jgi:hypothetical protein
MSLMTSNKSAVTAETQRRLQAIIEDKGLVESSRRLGVCRHTLEKAAGGLTVGNGTRALIAAKIAERDAAGKSP